MKLLIFYITLAFSGSFCLETNVVLPELHQYEKRFEDSETKEVIWDWISVHNDTGVYSNPKGSLNLSCTAPYPIEWNVEGYVVS